MAISQVSNNKSELCMPYAFESTLAPELWATSCWLHPCSQLQARTFLPGKHHLELSLEGKKLHWRFFSRQKQERGELSVEPLFWTARVQRRQQGESFSQAMKKQSSYHFQHKVYRYIAILVGWLEQGPELSSTCLHYNIKNKVTVSPFYWQTYNAVQ